MNADIREGRTLQQRRTLTIKFMELINASFNIPAEHIYITHTEHKGEDFHLYERHLTTWNTGDDPFAD